MSQPKTIKVSREWLGVTIPSVLPAMYAEIFDLTPQIALRNVIESLRLQAGTDGN